MENIGYVGLSKQMALREQMDLAAQNIANMSTPGYKARGMMFTDYMSKGEGAQGDKLHQVVGQTSFRRIDQGPMQQTHNPLDMAISGQGYFAIDTPNGVQYTRAGNFALSSDGTIVTAQGHSVQSAGGGPLQIPEGETQITVTADGTISTENGEIGQFKMVSFGDEQGLKEAGDGLYDADGAAELPTEGASIIQGAIEGSNVQPVKEMTEMIEILRSYQSTQRIMQGDHDRIRSAIRTLSETS